jgi:hypothetical protein
MTVYKVGDSIEEIDPATGEVVDTGVVVRIDGKNVWTLFDSCKERECYFYSYDMSFRVKAEVKAKPDETHEELAIIRDIHVGMRDCSKPVIYFTVDLLFGSALQIIEDIPEFIRETGCYKLEDLEGKPCIVERSNLGVRYSRIKK